jgi:hypothetical protein
MTLKIEISGDFNATVLPGNGNPGRENPDSEITVTITPFVILPSASRVFFNVGGAASSTLPDAATWALEHPGGELLLKDISGDVGVGITINKVGASTIDRFSNITININFGFYVLRVISGNWTIVG